MLKTFQVYVDAWKRGDVSELAKIYLNDPSLTVIWPDPTRVYPICGWHEVERALQETMNATGGMNLKYSEPHVQEMGDQALLTAPWTLVNANTAHWLSYIGKHTMANGRASFCFQKRNGTWRIIHEHSSVSPVLSPAKLNEIANSHLDRTNAGQQGRHVHAVKPN